MGESNPEAMKQTGWLVPTPKVYLYPYPFSYIYMYTTYILAHMCYLCVMSICIFVKFGNTYSIRIQKYIHKAYVNIKVQPPIPGQALLMMAESNSSRYTLPSLRTWCHWQPKHYDLPLSTENNTLLAVG